MKANNMNDTAVSSNSKVTSFRDYFNDQTELITEYVDEHTARVSGKWDGIDICAVIVDICVNIGVTLTIKDDERKELGIVSGLNIAADMFDDLNKRRPLTLVIEAAEKAVKNVLTYAACHPNKNGASIAKLEAALSNFDQKFSSTMSRYTYHNASIRVTDNASLVTAA